MNIKALFASKEKGGSANYEFPLRSDTRLVEGRSQIYSQLENMIEHLIVYREDFKGLRIPTFEKNFQKFQQSKMCKSPTKFHDNENSVYLP